MRRDARKRRISFSLTVEDIETNWQKPCRYCGDTTTTANLDRVDPKRGYEVGNVVPCCLTCNLLKGSLDLGTFVRQVRRVAAHTRRIRLPPRDKT